MGTCAYRQHQVAAAQRWGPTDLTSASPCGRERPSAGAEGNAAGQRAGTASLQGAIGFRLTCSRYLQGSLKSRRLRAAQKELWPRAITRCHKICRTGTPHAHEWRGALRTGGSHMGSCFFERSTDTQGGLQAIGEKLHPMENNCSGVRHKI